MEIIKHPPDNKKPVRRSILLKLGPEDYKRLEELQKRAGTTKSDTLRQCLQYVHRKQLGDK